MKIEFDVLITPKKMYDYMLRHTLTSFQGILGESVGVFLILAFIISIKWYYLIAGVIIIAYQPIELYFKAKRQVERNEAFKTPLHYELTDDGITVSSGDAKDFQSWNDMYRAVSTLRSIILYTTRVNACIFPKEDMGDSTNDVIEMIHTHMKPERVSIRGN